MVFIKRIEFSGFKSFATKTVVNFYDGLTGIIGPNGTGKSNIADAVKWVLGEQSIKSLRGKSTDDVIFSGARSFEPAAFAEVTIVFDNSNGILNFEGSEVQISRKAYRAEGNSEYIVNGNKVRLKDVKDIILNTGLGNTSLTIVSQGTITRLAEAKPEDRRIILNEAAGVSKYKIRKIETIRKLENVEDDLNLNKVQLEELNKQLKPLKQQSEKARTYKDLRQNLEEIELAIINKDAGAEIKELNTLKEQHRKSEIERDLADSLVNNAEDNKQNLGLKVIDYETRLSKLETQQVNLQAKINSIKSSNSANEDVSEKNIKSFIQGVEDELNSLIANEKQVKAEIEKIYADSFELKTQSSEATLHQNSLQFKISSLTNKATEIAQAKENKNYFPTAIAKIMENKEMFEGVIGIFGDLVSIESKYVEAITVALGKLASSIIVKTEKSTTKPIEFLKKNKYGYAIFVPLNTIKEPTLTSEDILIIKSFPGFLGMASEFVKPNSASKDLEKVINFTLAVTAVFDNADNAIAANKYIKNKLRIVTLDGTIFNNNGTVVGGYRNKGDSFFKIDEQAKKIGEEINLLDQELESIGVKLNDFNYKLVEKQKEQVVLSSRLGKFEERKTSLELKYDSLRSQFMRLTGKSYEKDSKREVNTITQVIDELANVNDEIKTIRETKIELQKEIHNADVLLEKLRKQQILWHDKVGEEKTSITRIEAKLDNYISILNNDYQISLDELLNTEHKLTIDFQVAKDKVAELRQKIKALGIVNIDSIEQFSEVHERFDSLTKAANDLIESKRILSETIDGLDKLMAKQFDDAFQDIRKEFKKVFVRAFNGGEADLIYTDPSDILESGIEVLAKPPGKTVNSISLYSGGEKAMIAVSLIFAIFNARPVPFLILDEAEAALDESNVERYGRYCKELNKKSQVIVVTHRPGTMEQCSFLYGVTMQQQGITKLISVEIDKAKEMSKA